MRERRGEAEDGLEEERGLRMQRRRSRRWVGREEGVENGEEAKEENGIGEN